MESAGFLRAVHPVTTAPKPESDSRCWRAKLANGVSGMGVSLISNRFRVVFFADLEPVMWLKIKRNEAVTLNLKNQVLQRLEFVG